MLNNDDRFKMKGNFIIDVATGSNFNLDRIEDIARLTSYLNTVIKLQNKINVNCVYRRCKNTIIIRYNSMGYIIHCESTEKDSNNKATNKREAKLNKVHTDKVESVIHNALDTYNLYKEMESYEIINDKELNLLNNERTINPVTRYNSTQILSLEGILRLADKKSCDTLMYILNSLKTDVETIKGQLHRQV